MSLILAIETATKICSVALSENGNILAIKEEGNTYSHAENLTVFVDEVLKKSNKTLQDLDAIAISKGPGSYTGLRIGTSSAKGFCYALNIPLISVSTLQSMAKNASENYTSSSKNILFAPMIDARRMEVYNAVYDIYNNETQPISAKIIDDQSFNEILKTNTVVFFGDGAEKCKETFQHQDAAIFYTGGLPSAKYIAQIATQKLKNNDVEDLAYFEPFYLKDFLATTPKKLL